MVDLSYSALTKIVTAIERIGVAAKVASEAYAKSIEERPAAPPYVINLKGDFTEGQPEWPNV